MMGNSSAGMNTTAQGFYHPNMPHLSAQTMVGQQMNANSMLPIHQHMINLKQGKAQNMGSFPQVQQPQQQPFTVNSQKTKINLQTGISVPRQSKTSPSIQVGDKTQASIEPSESPVKLSDKKANQSPANNDKEAAKAAAENDKHYIEECQRLAYLIEPTQNLLLSNYQDNTEDHPKQP